MANVGTVYESDDDPPTLVTVSEQTRDNVFSTNLLNEDSKSNSSPCPVTILSGFLGSGKTTLINYILHSPDHGRRIAVIENEYGNGRLGSAQNAQQPELSVESIIARDGVGGSNTSLTELLELPNGCICCTVKGSLVSTLELLVEKKRQDLDYILIECSGMANPGPIAALFWLDDALESRLRLDGIVTVVDCFNVGRQLNETVEAASQIAYADRIIANKVDLVVPQQLENVIDTIKGINSTVPILKTSYSKIPDLEWILDTKCYELDRIFHQQQAQFWNNSSVGICLPIQQPTFDTDSNLIQPSTTSKPSSWNKFNHKHTSGVSTITITVQGSVDLGRLNQWLATILWPNQDEKNSVLHELLEKSMTQSDNLKKISNMKNTVTISSNEDPQSSRDANMNPLHSDDNGPLSSQMNLQHEIFRIKGVISVAHVPDSNHHNIDRSEVLSCTLDRRRHIVQAVYDLWEIHPCTNDHFDWMNDNPDSRYCTFIIIGRCLERRSLLDGIQSCLIAKNEQSAATPSPTQMQYAS